MQSLNAEKANRERIEALRREVDARGVNAGLVAQQHQGLKRKAVVVTPQRSEPRARVVASSAPSSATFMPRSFMDHEILSVYNNRPAPDPRLPVVPFTKKDGHADGVFFLGAKKFVIEEDNDGNLGVRVGQNLESLDSWFAKHERVEALRLRGLQSGSSFLNMQQAGFVF
jgi:hypothetical protein